MADGGNDLSEALNGGSILLSHGTSLSLLSRVCTFLSSGTDFANVDAEDDWKKWKERDGMETYYFLLADTQTKDNMCALRAIVDRRKSAPPTPKPSSSSSAAVPAATGLPLSQRIVIDYTYTAPAFRGRGLANTLCSYVINLASVVGANVYVLALEESCPYWMEAHKFVLEEGANLNARFNIVSR
jgi:predicted GNAT family acetyltransferase